MIRILHGDCRDVLPTLHDGSVHCCVTSPPYYGLRSYLPDGHADKHMEIGLEKTPDEYVAQLVTVFREVRRVLRDDGTLWLNLGDSYAAGGMGQGSGKQLTNAGAAVAAKKAPAGYKPKDLLGIPWMVAFALRADGWYLRSDIIWSKPNPMPESVTDRPTKAHEYVFLLSKSARYWYDADAISEKGEWCGKQLSIVRGKKNRAYAMGRKPSGNEVHGADATSPETRNARSVWTIATQPYTGAHFATMPPSLAERCIKAGCLKGGTVLDPFGGSGTTALVADRLQRSAIIIELNEQYTAMSNDRIKGDVPMFADIAAE